MHATAFLRLSHSINTIGCLSLIKKILEGLRSANNGHIITYLRSCTCI